MRLLLLLGCLFTYSLFGDKATQECAVQCRAKGYQYHYCEMKCKNGKFTNDDHRDLTHAPLEGDLDIKCMNQCTKEGKSYSVCEPKCRY